MLSFFATKGEKWKMVLDSFKQFANGSKLSNFCHPVTRQKRRVLTPVLERVCPCLPATVRLKTGDNQSYDRLGGLRS